MLANIAYKISERLDEVIDAYDYNPETEAFLERQAELSDAFYDLGRLLDGTPADMSYGDVFKTIFNVTPR